MATFKIENLEEIESTLLKQAYLSGEAFPNPQDVKIFDQLKGVPNKKTHPALYHWHNFMALFTPAVRDAWVGKIAPEQSVKKNLAENANKDKEIAKTQTKATEEKPAAGATTADGTTPQVKPKKPKAAAKSVLVFDIKIYDTETDLQALAKKVYAIQKDGLVWNKSHKIVPVAFGINKLQIGCIVEDEKISTDDLFEQIEAWEDVQSTDIVTMQKH